MTTETKVQQAADGLDLDAIEAEAAAASPPPWRAGSVEREGKVWAFDPDALGGPMMGERCLFNANTHYPHTANRVFIAAARTNVPALVAALRSTRDAACLEYDGRELAERQRDEAQGRADRAEAQLARLRALHAPLVAAMADYDRAVAAHSAHVDAFCAIPHRERTREAMEALRIAHGDPQPKMQAAEVAVEAAACALLTAIAGESAGEWLRGRLDYDGTGP